MYTFISICPVFIPLNVSTGPRKPNNHAEFSETKRKEKVLRMNDTGSPLAEFSSSTCMAVMTLVHTNGYENKISSFNFSLTKISF